ncbi:MAG: RpoL/Rpb11 RNA polymerase subunit family protein [Candidatus Asgardarchaeia archaeon]
MKIKIVKENNEEIVMEIQGLTHTLANIISKRLNMYHEVKFAGYTISHPLVPKPVFRVVTDGKLKPREAFIKALKEVIDIYKEFKDKYEEALAEIK